MRKCSRDECGEHALWRCISCDKVFCSDCLVEHAEAEHDEVVSFED